MSVQNSQKSHVQKSIDEDHPSSPLTESGTPVTRRDEIKKMIMSRAETILLSPGNEALSKDEAIVMASFEYELRHQNSAANILAFNQALNAIRSEAGLLDDDMD